jgi:penicillin-binding protein 2
MKKSKSQDYYIPLSIGETFKKSVYFSDSLVIRLLLIIFSLFFFVSAGRVVYLQVFNQDRVSALGDNYVEIPDRGIIFDRNHKQLVANRKRFLVEINPLELKKDNSYREEFFNYLQSDFSLSDQDVSSLKDRVRLDFSENIFVTEVNEDKYFESVSKIDKYPGLSLSAGINREYLENGSMSHILGYTSPPNLNDLGYELDSSQLYKMHIGRGGVEEYYNSILSGKPLIETFGKLEQDYEEARNLILTIDVELQKSIEGLMQDSLNDYGKEKASAIVMDVQTGEVLSMVSYPFYDNNLWTNPQENSDKIRELLNDQERSPLINRSISGVYPPGSTFKPVVAQFALNDGLIDEETTIEDTGAFKIAEKTFYGWNKSGLGRLDVKGAIAQSSNIYFHTLAGGLLEEGHEMDGLGYEKMISYMKMFEMDRPTGVDIANEFTGFIPTEEWKKQKYDEEWFIGDTAQLGTGQGSMLVTPLKLLQINSVVANGGKLITPFVLDQVLDQSGKIVQKKKPQIKDMGFDQKNLNLIKEGMRMTVTHPRGTARDLNFRSIEILGKTGTAERYSNDPEPHAWFVGFSPYKDTRYGVVVIIENGLEGGNTAAPLAGEIFKRLKEFGYLQ